MSLERLQRAEREQYWEKMLSKGAMTERQFVDTYEQLYGNARIQAEDELEYLRAYYRSKPDDFNPRDPALNLKAAKFAGCTQRTDKYKDDL